MNSKLILAALASLAFGTAAQAAEVVCTGKYINTYNFTINAALDSDNEVDGKINVAVKGPNLNQTSSLDVISSDVVPGQHIRMAGKNEKGNGSLDATRNPSTGQYPGRLHADGGSLGKLDVNVVCLLNDSDIFVLPDAELEEMN